MINEILLLDDDRFMQKFIRNILSQTYNVHCFSSIKDASAFLETQLVELIITDINLKGESGITFINSLKNNQKLAHIPIITLSGENSSKIKIKTLEMGIDDYIVKPFSPNELNIRIKNILEKYRKFSEFTTKKLHYQSFNELEIKPKKIILSINNTLEIIRKSLLICILFPIYLFIVFIINIDELDINFHFYKRSNEKFELIPVLEFRSKKDNSNHFYFNQILKTHKESTFSLLRRYNKFINYFNNLN